MTGADDGSVAAEYRRASSPAALSVESSFTAEVRLPAARHAGVRVVSQAECTHNAGQSI